MGGTRKRIKQERREQRIQAESHEVLEATAEQASPKYPDARGKTLRQHLKRCGVELEDWGSPYGYLIMRCECGVAFCLDDVIPKRCPQEPDCLIEDLRKPEMIADQAQKNRAVTGYVARANARALRKLRKR